MIIFPNMILVISFEGGIKLIKPKIIKLLDERFMQSQIGKKKEIKSRKYRSLLINLNRV